MTDLSDKGSGSDDQGKKSCSDCQTTKTPLWRGGPAGPKSLCNACGIRYRKKRRALLGLNKSSSDLKKKEGCNKKDRSAAAASIGMSLKLRLLSMGEEEQAAVLLMALSCGSVYS
ncbi:hypothetical protein Sjap_007352 [Stephania japonica]|uniref:GATA-type domain-containing protein n=1 Tax=Stephania japonica TaxID=461633 RepID=A0AAP0JP65_9MAGN